MISLKNKMVLSASEIAILERANNKTINENYVSLSDFRSLPTSDFWFEIDVHNLVDEGFLKDYKNGFYNITKKGVEFLETRYI